MSNTPGFLFDTIMLNNGVGFSPKPLTIIVGSNNSGKTRLLKEIKQFTVNKDNDLKILHSITAKPCDLTKLFEQLGIEQTSDSSGDQVSYTLRTHFEQLNQGSNKLHHQTLVKDVATDALRSSIFKDMLGKMIAAHISTEDRLIAAKAARRVSSDDKSVLVSMYREGTGIEKQLSDFVFRAFKKRIKLDFTNIPQISIRVGDDFSQLPADPRDSLPILSKLPLLEDEGDGLRSFVTTLVLLLVSRVPYLLLDEPEAFLHPPQAAELGRIIAELASPTKNVILSTHSVDLLRGILSMQPDLNIIRLTRTSTSSSAHLLDIKEIQEVTKNPLLSSNRVLDSLFYQGCVIVEGDSDRLFYDKLAREYQPNDDIHYTHSQSKQSIQQFLPPYLKTNVRFACILDFDILRVPGDLKKLLQSAGFKDVEKAIQLQQEIQQEINGKSLQEKYNLFITESLATLQAAPQPGNSIDSDTAEKTLRKMKNEFAERFDETDRWIDVKKTGIAALSKKSQATFSELTRICQSGGIFIVPFGSLEGSLASEGIPYSSNKKAWLQRAVDWLDQNKLGASSEVLLFIKQIHTYLRTE